MNEPKNNEEDESLTLDLDKFDNIKKNMLKALAKTKGIISSACLKAKVSRQTHYNWMEADPEYKKAVELIDELAIDMTESQLYSKIQGGDITAIIFHLKTKGKKRGYVERQEIDHNPEGSSVKIDLTGYTYEELLRLSAGDGGKKGGEPGAKS